MTHKFKMLVNHEGFIRYFKNTSWLFAEKILRLVVGFFISIWVARYLGPDQFGLFSYAQSFVALFTAIATLGLDGIVVRELVKDESREYEILCTAFWLKLIGAFIVLFLLGITVNFTSNNHTTNVIVFVIASAIVLQAFNIVDFYFQAKVLSKYIVLANVITLFFSTIIKIFLILNKASLLAFAWVVLFDSVVLALGFIYFFIKYKTISTLPVIFQKSTAVLLLKDSWPLMLGGFSFIVFSNIDTIMIKEIMSDFYVGIYNSAYRLVTLWYFLPGLVLSSLMPSLIKSYQNSKLFMDRLLMISTALIWISIVVWLVYNIFDELIIKTTYGDKYIDAVNLLGSLAGINLFIFFNSVWNSWMILENKTKQTFFFHITVALLNTVLNYFLIHEYGVNGAVYALLLSFTITYIVFGINDKRILKLFIESICLKILWKKK